MLTENGRAFANVGPMFAQCIGHTFASFSQHRPPLVVKVGPDLADTGPFLASLDATSAGLGRMRHSTELAQTFPRYAPDAPEVGEDASEVGGWNAYSSARERLARRGRGAFGLGGGWRSQRGSESAFDEASFTLGGGSSREVMTRVGLKRRGRWAPSPARGLERNVTRISLPELGFGRADMPLAHVDAVEPNFEVASRPALRGRSRAASGRSRPQTSSPCSLHPSYGCPVELAPRRTQTRHLRQRQPMCSPPPRRLATIVLLEPAEADNNSYARVARAWGNKKLRVRADDHQLSSESAAWVHMSQRYAFSAHARIVLRRSPLSTPRAGHEHIRATRTARRYDDSSGTNGEGCKTKSRDTT